MVTILKTDQKQISALYKELRNIEAQDGEFGFSDSEIENVKSILTKEYFMEPNEESVEPPKNFGISFDRPSSYSSLITNSENVTKPLMFQLMRDLEKIAFTPKTETKTKKYVRRGPPGNLAAWTGDYCTDSVGNRGRKESYTTFQSGLTIYVTENQGGIRIMAEKKFTTVEKCERLNVPYKSLNLGL